MNYPQLVAEIQTYTENQFASTDLNTFIQQAEQRIYNSVQLPAIRKNSTSTLTAGNQYLAMPGDWLATFSLSVVDGNGDYQYLLNKDVNFIRAAYPSPNDQAIPEYYAVFNDVSFILGPTPDIAYAVELNYYYYPESIVTAINTWLGDNYDSALLYGALLEANTFMKGEQDVMQAYQKRYDEAMILLKMLGDGKDRRDAYRSGQIRVPVT
jgi:hypothetical protein